MPCMCVGEGIAEPSLASALFLSALYLIRQDTGSRLNQVEVIELIQLIQLPP